MTSENKIDFNDLKKFAEHHYLSDVRKNLGPTITNRWRTNIRLIKNESELDKFLKETINGDINKVIEEYNKENTTYTAGVEEPYETILTDFRSSPKLGMHTLAKHFLDNYSILTVNDTNEIFIYKKGVYEGKGDKFISTIIQKILRELCAIHIINEVLGHIKRLTYKKREDILEPETKICLENGILNLNSLEIEQHTPEIIFFNKLPVKYIKDADCPLIKNFLSEIVQKDSIPILQEFIGYCLLKAYPINKALMLVGVGANGKSTFIILLKNFLGFPNCVSIPLQQLENNRFAVSGLFGKLANMFADLPAKALKETSIFKMLTGGDLIPAEKKFKDNFFFVNYSKQIFSCNQIPKSPDDSDAFFRRWIIINFPNQFIGKDADKKLIKKLTIKTELSGLLNFAIEGLKRILKEEEFTNSKSISEIREVYMRQSDSVASFIMDCVLITPDYHEEKRKLYTHYAEYCRINNYPIVAENTFHRELAKKVRVEDYKPQKKDEEGKNIRVPCWKGIKFNVNGVKDVKENSNLNKGLLDEMEIKYA